MPKSFSAGEPFVPSAGYFNEVSDAVRWVQQQQTIERSKLQRGYKHSGIVWVKVNGAVNVPRFGMVFLDEPMFIPDGTAWDEELLDEMLGRICFKADLIAGGDDFWDIYAEYKHPVILQEPWEYQQERLVPAVADGLSFCKLFWTDPGANKPNSFPATAWPGSAGATAQIGGPLKIVWKEEDENDDGFRWALVKVDSHMDSPISVRGTMDAAVTLGGSGTLNLTTPLGTVSAIDVDVPYFDVEAGDAVRAVWDGQMGKFIVIAIVCPIVSGGDSAEGGGAAGGGDSIDGGTSDIPDGDLDGGAP